LEKPTQENPTLQNKEITKETKNKRNTEDISAFESWWSDWRMKVTRNPGRKAKAKEHFKRLLANFSVAEIEIATNHYLAECGDSFTKDAERFLVADLIQQHQEPPIVPIRGKPQEQPRRLTAQEQSVKRMLEDYAERHGETGDSGFGNGFDEFEQTHTGRITPTLGSSLLQ
jgi:hypothetical protein